MQAEGPTTKKHRTTFQPKGLNRQTIPTGNIILLKQRKDQQHYIN